jgi:hypothetical protein
MCHPGTDSHFTYWWLEMNGVFWFSFSRLKTAIFRHAFTAYARDISVSGRFAKLSGECTRTSPVVFLFLFQFSLDFLYFFYSHFSESMSFHILYSYLNPSISFSVFSRASFSLNFSQNFTILTPSPILTVLLAKLQNCLFCTIIVKKTV